MHYYWLTDFVHERLRYALHQMSQMSLRCIQWQFESRPTVHDDSHALCLLCGVWVYFCEEPWEESLTAFFLCFLPSVVGTCTMLDKYSRLLKIHFWKILHRHCLSLTVSKTLHILFMCCVLNRLNLQMHFFKSRISFPATARIFHSRACIEYITFIWYIGSKYQALNTV